MMLEEIREFAREHPSKEINAGLKDIQENIAPWEAVISFMQNQKINLYYVEESDGNYSFNPIYEDPTHDLISIIIPIPKQDSIVRNVD